MNKRIYSLVWNRTLNQVVVASELASCKNGASSARGSASVLRRNVLVLALLSAMAAIVPVQAFAGDTNCGGPNQIASGFAGIDTDNRIGVGYGKSNGESALSIGYQRKLSRSATFTIGGAVSHSENSVGAGVGFGW